MPYRRLPTTDKARFRALNAALTMAEKRNDNRLAFSKHTLYELKNIKTAFENDLTHYELNANIESEKSGAYKKGWDKARLYVSHFIKVLYMSIEREEMKEGELVHYGLEDQDMKVPSLANEEEVIHWGWKIIDGEQKRRQKGGSPFYNPSVALVKVQIENFQDAAIFQKNLKRNTRRSFEKIQKTRKETNAFIQRLWTEIEENLTGDSPKHKRQQAQDYGVVYVFRRKERRKLKQEDLQVDLLFEFN